MNASAELSSSTRRTASTPPVQTDHGSRPGEPCALLVRRLERRLLRGAVAGGVGRAVRVAACGGECRMRVARGLLWMTHGAPADHRTAARAAARARGSGYVSRRVRTVSESLVVVDMQRLFVAAVAEQTPRSVDAVNRRVAETLAHGGAVFYTRDVRPTDDGQGTELAAGLDVRGPVLDKGPGTHGGFSGFVLARTAAPPGAGALSQLAAHLAAAGTTRVIVAGLAADVCVSPTARDAARLGYPNRRRARRDRLRARPSRWPRGGTRRAPRSGNRAADSTVVRSRQSAMSLP